MKRTMTAVLGLALVMGSALAQDTKKSAPAPKAAADPELKDLKQKASYSFGLNMGRQLKAQSIDIDPDVVARGVRDALAGKPALTDEQIQDVMKALRQDITAKKKAEGEAFLAAN